MAVEPSILKSVKKVLGIESTLTVYDQDILMHINTTFATLHQLGIGPEEGFEIGDDTAEWDDLLEGDPRRNNVKSYVYLKTKTLFDPPTTSFLIDATQKNIAELEHRINTYREETEWTDPNEETSED